MIEKKNLQIDLKKYCHANQIVREARRTAPLPSDNLRGSLGMGTVHQTPNATETEIKNCSWFKKTGIRTLSLYNCNLEFYQTNQSKLESALTWELRRRNYLHAKKIMEFLKKKDEISFSKNTNLKSFEEELKVFNQFLLELYQRKKMKEIGIICDNIKEQEQIIAAKTSLLQYEQIYSNLELKTSKSRNYDFISQYQQICTNYGVADGNIRPHIRIKNHLERMKEKVVMAFDKTREEKQRRKFIIKSSSRFANRQY